MLTWTWTACNNILLPYTRTYVGHRHWTDTMDKSSWTLPPLYMSPRGMCKLCRPLPSCLAHAGALSFSTSLQPTTCLSLTHQTVDMPADCYIYLDVLYTNAARLQLCNTIETLYQDTKMHRGLGPGQTYTKPGHGCCWNCLPTVDMGQGCIGFCLTCAKTPCYYAP